jgi:hypothetical protein
MDISISVGCDMFSMVYVVDKQYVNMSDQQSDMIDWRYNVQWPQRIKVKLSYYREAALE